MAARLAKTSTPGVFKRGSRYVVRFRDPSGVVRQTSAGTLAEARRLKAANVTAVDDGSWQQKRKVSFAAYAAEWLGTFQGRTSKGLRLETRRQYGFYLGLELGDEGSARRSPIAGRADTSAIGYFGKRQLASITTPDVKSYIQTVFDADNGRLSYDSVRLHLAAVKLVLGSAVEDGLIRVNPADRVRVPRRALTEAELDEADGEVKALEPDELRALIAEISDDWRLLVTLLAGTGLRISEAVALRWSDVDLGAMTLSVRRRWYKGRFGPPKTTSSRRDVPLPQGLGQMLFREKAARRPDEGELIFGRPNRQGEIVPPAQPSVAYALGRAAERAGIKWAVGCHTMRHSYASSAFSAGLNAVQVSRLLGHADANVTLRVYIHLLRSDTPDATFVDAILPDRSQDTPVDEPTEEEKATG